MTMMSMKVAINEGPAAKWMSTHVDTLSLETKYLNSMFNAVSKKAICYKMTYFT